MTGLDINPMDRRSDQERRADDIAQADELARREWKRWALQLAIAVSLAGLTAYFASNQAIAVALETKASKESVNVLRERQATVEAKQTSYDTQLPRMEAKIDHLSDQLTQALLNLRVR